MAFYTIIGSAALDRGYIREPHPEANVHLSRAVQERTAPRLCRGVSIQYSIFNSDGTTADDILWIGRTESWSTHAGRTIAARQLSPSPAPSILDFQRRIRAI